jgi:hypothetical protein
MIKENSVGSQMREQKFQVHSAFHPQQNPFPINSSKEERKHTIFQLIPGPQANRKNKEDGLLMQEKVENVKKSDSQPMISQDSILSNERLNAFPFLHQILSQYKPAEVNNPQTRVERIEREDDKNI